MLALLILLVTFVAGFCLGHATRAWRSHKRRERYKMYAPYTAGSRASLAVGPRNYSHTSDDIHEIFRHARKLIAEDEHRFVLDKRKFMEAMEEMPLFLRSA
jgi:hypothetical protein